VTSPRPHPLGATSRPDRGVNTYANFDPGVSLGCYKMSGLGKELSHDGIEEYFDTKSVWMATA
jgi:acyl-CoA reductase-like NAD-dependent aldehyde dehydrogenase